MKTRRHSPPKTNRDHRRSDRRDGNDYVLRGRDPPFQSLTPPDRDRPRQRPQSPCRDYGRRPDHHNHNERSLYNGGFARRGSPPPQSMMNNVGVVKSGLDSEKGAGFPANRSSPGLNLSSNLLKKPIYLDDGSVRTFFSLPVDGGYPSEPAPLNPSTGGFTTGVAGEMYNGLDKRKLYAREAPYSTTFGGSTSSGGGGGGAKDDFSSSYRHGYHLPTGGFNKYKDELERDGYGQRPLFGHHPDSKPYQRGDLLSPPRDGTRYSELYWTEGGSLDYRSDKLYKKMSWDSGVNYDEPLELGIADPIRDRINCDVEVSRKSLRESDLWDRRPLHDEVALNYREVKGVSSINDEFVDPLRRQYELGSGSLSRDQGSLHLGREYDFGRDVAPLSYRDGLRNSLMSEREVDMYRLDASPRVRQNMDDGFGMGERMLKREYVGDAEEDGCSIRSMHPVEDGRTVRSVHPVEDGRNVRNVHPVEDGRSVRSVHPVGQNFSRRIRIIEEEDDEWTMVDDESEWTDDNRMDLVQFPSKRLRYERTLHRTKPHVTERISSRGASGYVEVGMHENRLRFGRDFSMRRRLRPGPVNYSNSFNFVRRRDFYKPHKYWKKNFEGHHGGVHEEAPLESDAPPAKVDLPEDSEEFKQQVEKAFLRFTKLLNETPHQRRRYQEQGKADKLLCSVCGSLSKEFTDTHSLVTHAFHSLKVGLRADHLGLHKALCLLMDWNWLIAPDTGKLYERPNSETRAVKEDLILWPPFVVIHNSSIGKKTAKEPKVVTIEGMEETLTAMGFAGRARVCRGKPANHSILVVKFNPTFSGLRDAGKLHNHYAENKRGRNEFEQLNESSNGDGSEKSDKVEELLYGYLATAGDLDKLDQETKKRCMIKSKKEIEAIADAPLKTD